jgi:hypothetical protein
MRQTLNFLHCHEHMFGDSTVLFSRSSELLGFWTLSTIRNSKYRKHSVSETGSVSVLRWGKGDTYCGGSRILVVLKDIHHRQNTSDFNSRSCFALVFAWKWNMIFPTVSILFQRIRDLRKRFFMNETRVTEKNQTSFKCRGLEWVERPVLMM